MVSQPGNRDAAEEDGDDPSGAQEEWGEGYVRRYIGIDCGKEGAFAMIDEDGNVEVYPMDEWLLIQKLTDWAFDDCVAYVEKASVRHGQGISSSGAFMEGAGFIRGVIQTSHIPFELIPPAKWKKPFGANLGREFSYAEKKAKDIEICKRLFPNVSIKKSSRCKNDSDGMADALLIAEYCRRTCK